MNFDKLNEPKQTYKKVKFLSLTPGIHQIRILDQDSLLVYTHYIPSSRTTVKCLGQECPICDNNKRLQVENPKGYKTSTGYIPTSKRWLMNVLDRSQIKVCPSCGAEIKRFGKQFLPTCSSCNAIISDVPVTQANEVKVLSVGVDVATRISSLETTMIDTTGEDIPITSYDIILSVIGTGKDKQTTPIKASAEDVVNISKEDLHDLTQATLTLSAKEIGDLLRGVSIKDIFAGRRNSLQLPSVDSVESHVAKVTSELSGLFDGE